MFKNIINKFKSWSNLWLFSSNHNIFSLNSILLYIKRYIQIILICFFLLILYSLYININSFYLIIICLNLLFLIFLILLIKKNTSFFNNNTLFSKILLNLSNKNYNFFIQRILFFKFIIFYIYVSSDFNYCDSFITQILHNTFMEVGKNIGITPKTNVSVLETIGMFTIISTISYGTIKGYQLLNGIENKTINDRLNNIETKLNEIYYKQNNTDININILDEKINKVLEVESQIIKGIEVSSQIIEEKICRVGNDLNNVEKEIIKELNDITTNQVNKNIFESQINSLSNNINNNINEVKNKIIEKLNHEEINEETKIELQNLLIELSNLNESTKKTINDINLDIVPYSTINSLPENIQNLIGFKPKSTYTPELTNFNPITRKMYGEIRKTQSLSNSSFKKSNFEVNDSLIIQKNINDIELKKYYELRATDNSLTFSEVFINEMKQEPSSISKVARTLCNNIPIDVIYRTTTTILSQAIANSISLSTVVILLENLGLKTPSYPSNAENAGRVISHTIRDFLRGMKN